MLFNSLKKFIKRFSFVYNILRKTKDKLIILSRLKDVVMMMILFNIWPEQVYRFSTRNFLPSKKKRFSKNSKPLIPYELLSSRSSKIMKMKEINLVSVGSSFDLKNIDKLQGPTFLITYWTPLKKNNNGEIIYKHPKEWETSKFDFFEYFKENNDKKLQDFKKENLTYVMARTNVLKYFKKNGYKTLSVNIYLRNSNGEDYTKNKDIGTEAYKNLIDDDQCKCIAVSEKIYKPDSEFVPAGSFLPAICAFSYFAEKINVYGWDFYLESSPKKMNYWNLLFNMYKYGPDVSRSKNHFESALVNFYYAYQLSKLPNINIDSYLGHLGKHKKLINKIEKVLFN